MARRPGPSVRSRRLALALRRFRRDIGLTGADVAKALGMSASKLSRVENGEAGIYIDDVEMLLDFYRVPRHRRAHLLDLARRSEERGLLRAPNTHLPEDWQMWAEFEDEATGLRFFEPLIIPGPLQTAEYATAIIRTTGHLTEDQVAALVESRQARQALLTRRDPVRLQAVVEQRAIERHFGGRGAHSRQVRHLMGMADLPNVSVRVLPDEAGMHPGMTGSFVIVEYDDDPSVVLLENKVSSVFLDESEQVAVFEDTWNEVSKLALDDVQTAEYLKRLA